MRRVLRSRARNSGSSDRIRRQLAVTLTAMTSSHVLGSSWCRGVSRPRTPALPTKASSRPHRRLRASPSRSMAAKSRRSMGTRVVASGSSGRSARISSSSSSRPPWVRASATTCAPDLAKARAAARPMPREAPVTRAIRGDPSGLNSLNRHSSSHLLGSPMGYDCGRTQDEGGLVVAGDRRGVTSVDFPSRQL